MSGKMKNMDSERLTYAIQAKGLVKSYGHGNTSVQALKEIHLDIPHGCVWAVMGPSGSGKTTLLTILGLVTKPTQGNLLLEGRDVYEGRKPDLARIRRETTGFIFQSPNLIPFLTAEENVLLSLSLVGIRGTQARARVAELLEYLEITDRATFYPNQLSGGEQQRVAIARALANNPRIILADEPTASLDTDRALAVMRLLHKVSRENNTTVLVVTHDYRLMDQVDHVIEMMDGRIVAEKIPNSGEPDSSPSMRTTT